MLLLKTSSQKNKKEVTISSIMNKKIRKMLIIQLSFIEVILVALLFDVEQKSCITETRKDNLLVYNYTSNKLLDSRVIKENVVIETEKIDEDNTVTASFTAKEESDVTEDNETKQVSEEVEQKPTPVAPIVRDVNSSLADNLVSYAKGFVGYPYVYGGNSLTEGTDCSGFTKLIYASYGINLPRTALEQSYVGVEVSLNDIQIGDLVLSGYNGTTHHVAIYIGDGQIVHALNSNVGIVITNLYIMPITHIRRVL